MRTNTNSRMGLLVWVGTLFAFPLLMGAKGNGCVAGGDVIVGSSDAGNVSAPSCVRADCEGKPIRTIGTICPTGQTPTTECTAASDGSCDWTFPCVNSSTDGVASSPIQCSLADCAGMAATLEALICPDGTSVGRTVCLKTDTASACHWDFPPCPPLPDVECDPKACAGQGSPSIGCVNATAKDICVKSSDDTCHWKVTCVPSGNTSSCTEQDCQGKSVPGRACLAPTTMQKECRRDSTGTCSWTVECVDTGDEPASCSASDCAGQLSSAIGCATGRPETVCTRAEDRSCYWKTTCAQ